MRRCRWTKEAAQRTIENDKRDVHCFSQQYRFSKRDPSRGREQEGSRCKSWRDLILWHTRAFRRETAKRTATGGWRATEEQKGRESRVMEGVPPGGRKTNEKRADADEDEAGDEGVETAE
jgi:hypothetical protein